MSQIALVTGASRGLGLALTRILSRSGWDIVVDARGSEELKAAISDLAGVIQVPGDVTDTDHRQALARAIEPLGRLDLLVNNASFLGPSPQPGLAGYPLDVLRRVYEVNVLAPLALLQEFLPLLRRSHGVVLNITSDAGIEGYPGWGGYGSSKAALEQMSRVLAAEETDLRVYWVDPGDMNTTMHQEAYPGEDISDRPPPEESVPGLLALIEGTLPSGRYQARTVPVSDP